MDLLVELNQQQGITVLMVTHEPDMALYARRVLHFRDGVLAIDEDGRGRAAPAVAREAGA